MKVATAVFPLIASQYGEWAKALRAKEGLTKRIPGLHVYGMALLKKGESLETCTYGGSKDFADLYLDEEVVEEKLQEDWDAESATFKGDECHGVAVVVLPDTHVDQLRSIFAVEYQVAESCSVVPSGEASERSAPVSSVREPPGASS
jgi:hypothetical protein